jgi:hypothetical protein
MADKVTTHGSFTAVAALAQTLKNDIGDSKLDAASLEAISQIFTRIARIVVGDENHRKHWEDIQGFCQVKLDAIAPPPASIESDIQRLVRTLPVVRAERNNGPA